MRFSLPGSRRPLGWLLVAVLGAGALTGCATSAGNRQAPDGRLRVAASISVWGSVLAQLGGDRVSETSIIAKPNVDPHEYEPTPADGRVIADAAVFVENGVGYDSWAAKTVAASPDRGRRVVDVGRLLRVPAGGNPHRWYSPTDVVSVATAISTALQAADPQDSAYFHDQLADFLGNRLATYHALVDQLRTRYAGVAVGASESIFAPLAARLGLRLITPASFLQAISEGNDPSAADKALCDRQLAEHQVQVYVFNTQNVTPDVSAQVSAARRAGIPVAPVTESLTPSGASFQDWQVAQLRELAAALRQATGR